MKTKLLLFITIALFQVNYSFSQVSEIERSALIALYDSTDGANWINNTNWGSTEPVSSWYGITVIDDQVEIIQLNNNSLNGTIPSEIGDLIHLTNLQMVSNELSGSIPVEIGNLTSLTHLNLSLNELSGSIPDEIGNLSSLFYLRFTSNLLEDSIPSVIWNLTNLNFLSFASNNLVGTIPIEVSNLTNLSTLSLNSNQLNGPIPSEIGALTNLTSLRLNINSFEDTLPSELGNLTNLVSLNISYNQFTGNIPNEIWSLSNLTTLMLNNNQFEGNIPAEISNLSSIETLLLNNNLFTGTIPSEIGLLSNLEYLYLYFNDFEGELPYEFTNLSNLSSLKIDYNLFDSIPDLSGNSSLTTFSVINNSLQFDDVEANISISNFQYSSQAIVPVQSLVSIDEGDELSLHVSVGGEFNEYQWTKDNIDILDANADSLIIESVSLSDAGIYQLRINNSIATDLTLISGQITVTIDSSEGFPIDEYNALIALYDSTNGDDWTNNTNWLSDEPVSTWYGVTVADNNVVLLQLFANNLNGSLPSEIGNLTSLTNFSISYNPLLIGGIPSEITNLTSLTTLNISFNQLSGNIPNYIGNLTQLTSLNMSTNLINGTLPSELGDLNNLTYLNIGSNELTGEIPSSLGDLTLLTDLQLYENQLSGNIPEEIWSLDSLINLGLFVNELEGSLPSTIGGLNNIEKLLLNNNQFTGTLPTVIGSLHTLTDIACDNNQLSGTIPSELSDLVNLKTLNLAYNQFEGTLPIELTYLSDLILILLNDNFFDSIPDFSGIDSLEYLWIQENALEFDDLEPHVGISNFTYSPQDNINGIPPIIINEGEELSFSLHVGGSANIYQWYKEGTAVSGQTSNTFFVSSANISDAGTYTLEITNTIATELTLYSEEIIVDVLVGIMENTSNANFSLYPNPTSGIFSIELNNHYAEVLVNIYSLDGRLLHSERKENIDRLKMEFSQQKGIYLVEVLADTENRTFKIIIN